MPRVALLCLTLSLYVAACASRKQISCDELGVTGQPPTLAKRSHIVQFVASKVSPPPWGAELPEAVFTVRRGARLSFNSTTLQQYILWPIWATDERPYVIGCINDRDVIALSGFEIPDARPIMALGDADNSSDVALLRAAEQFARVFDTNTGEQRIIEALDSSALKRGTQWDSVSRAHDSPRIRRDGTGNTIVLAAQSANLWDALGVFDSLRYRFRYDPTGRLLWFDRVVLAGRWKMDGAKLDSIRVQRN